MYHKPLNSSHLCIQEWNFWPLLIFIHLVINFLVPAHPRLLRSKYDPDLFNDYSVKEDKRPNLFREFFGLLSSSFLLFNQCFGWYITSSSDVICTLVRKVKLVLVILLGIQNKNEFDLVTF